MPAIAFKNLDGQAAWAYNYGNIIKDAGQLDYINRNSIEFIPMYNGAYATMTTTEDVPGWSGGLAASNVRCYFWQDAVPTNPNNENARRRRRRGKIGAIGSEGTGKGGSNFWKWCCKRE